LSTTEIYERARPAEVLAGYMSAAAIFIAATAVVYRPLPLSLAALALSLVATAIGGRWGNLHAFAVGAATVGFVGGMTVAALTGHPLY
jgi:hypothetical protein